MTIAAANPFANENNSPLVSIVIPAYNHAAYLDAAVCSVLAQTYPNIELIVLDDGSSDDTQKLLSKYASRFYCETHANVGQAATLNKGWAMSRGEILSYLSADDRLLPSAVSEAVNVLNARPDLIMTYCDFHMIDQAGRNVRTIHAPDYDYYEMVVNTVCMPGPGVFFQRNAWQRAGGWNIALKQWPDYEYWIRLGLLGPFARIATPCAEFRVHGDSQTFAPVAFERAEEPLQILQRYYASPHPLPADIVAAKSRAMSSAALASAQLHFRAGRLATGIARACMAFRTHGRSLFRLSAWKLIFHGLLSRPLMSLRVALSRIG